MESATFSKEFPVLQGGLKRTIDYCLFHVMIDIKDYVIAHNMLPTFTSNYQIEETVKGYIACVKVTATIWHAKGGD